MKATIIWQDGSTTRREVVDYLDVEHDVDATTRDDTHRNVNRVRGVAIHKPEGMPDDADVEIDGIGYRLRYMRSSRSDGREEYRLEPR